MTRTYLCKTCGEFDHQCKITDDVLRVCPTCDSPVQRVFSATPIIWKTDGCFGKSNVGS